MDVPPELDRLRNLLWELRAESCAVYRVRSVGAVEELELWGTLSQYATTPDQRRKLDEAWRRYALECLRRNGNLIAEPKPASVVNAEGERWWGLVLAHGAVRDSGYVIAMYLAARTADDVRAKKATIERVFEKPRFGDTEDRTGLI